jgi:uncharacterized membrane protein YkvI
MHALAANFLYFLFFSCWARTQTITQRNIGPALEKKEKGSYAWPAVVLSHSLNMCAHNDFVFVPAHNSKKKEQRLVSQLLGA